MDRYMEQSVAGKGNLKSSVLYALCWAAAVTAVLLGVAFAAGVVAEDPEVLRINWLNVVLTAACLATAIVFYRIKDRLRVEYDYFLYPDRLEICGILNRRRRKRYASISMEHITACGNTGDDEYNKLLSRPGLKRHNWYVDAQSELSYICYNAETTRHMAVLELNRELIRALSANKRLPNGAWRIKEGKT